MKLSKRLLCGVAATTLIGTVGAFAEAPKMKMTTEIPAAITTPDSIESRIGELNFTDGYPDDATTKTIYDNLDFMRGVDAFSMPCPVHRLKPCGSGGVSREQTTTRPS